MPDSEDRFVGVFVWRNRPPSVRAIRRAWLTDVIIQMWEQSRRTYGWRRVQAELADTFDHVANTKLVRAMNIEGVSRQRRKVFTTRQGPPAVHAPDLVKRIFPATTPNGLWVTGRTYASMRSAMEYVCFITDSFSRKIVGWRVAAHMCTDMFLYWKTPAEALNEQLLSLHQTGFAITD